MYSIKDFYERVWREYADPRFHPITAEALRIQTRVVGSLIARGQPRRILDLGCGPAPVVDPQSAPLVVSADFIFDMLRFLKGRDSRLRPVCLDAGCLPFKPRQFDLVWCGLLADHIDAAARWVEGLLAVVSPGGTLGLASWKRGVLPPERYPCGRMRFTTAEGDDLEVPSYANWGEVLEAARRCGPAVSLDEYPVVDGTYVLEVVTMRVKGTPL